MNCFIHKEPLNYKCIKPTQKSEHHDELLVAIKGTGIIRHSSALTLTKYAFVMLFAKLNIYSEHKRQETLFIIKL